MRRLGAIAIAVLGSWLFTGSALAEKRVALVIGNSAYKSVPPLSNPANDAGIVSAMFTNAGFDSVDTKLNLSVVEMRKEILPASQAVLDAAYKRWLGGETSILEYFDAQQDYNDVVRQYRDTLVRYRNAMLDLNTAVSERVVP